jgi:hypothetical protein
MSIVLVGSTSGSVTLQEPAVAGTTVLDLPATSGTLLTTGTTVTAAQGGTGLTSPGTAGNVLTSNGTSWVSSTPSVPSAGTGPAFFAYQSTQQNPSANTWTKVNLQTELFDTNSNFASSRFTPTVAGYYQINGTLGIDDYLSTAFLQCAVYKNGTTFVRGASSKGDSNDLAYCNVSTVVFLNGSTDYVELYYYGDSTNILTSNQSTNLSGALVRSA